MEKNIKNNYSIVNLAAEDLTPQNIGVYRNNSEKWVPYSETNDYPVYLRKLYLSSPTHQAVCDTIINLATGDGIEVIDGINNPTSTKFINNNFSKDVIKQLITDLYIYGYAVVMLYNNGKIVKYTEAIKYRFEKEDENGDINNLWYSEDWEDRYKHRNRPVAIPVFYEGCDYDKSVMYIQLDKKSLPYYSPVSYQGGINYINCEVELSQFHLANLRNGFFAGFIINFIGQNFSDEQKAQIENSLKNKFNGTVNNNKAIASFIANKDEAAVITPINQPNLVNQYVTLTAEVTNKILIAHGLTSPLLAGIRTEGGGLGNNANEMQEAYNLFYQSKLKGIQNYILQLIKNIMESNLLFADIEFITYNPFATTKEDVTMAKENKINEVESRKIIELIDSTAVKPYAPKINEYIFDGELNDGALYKFVKISKKNNMIIKKFEILDKKGFLFQPSNLIKNTKDYYFLEQKFIKNNLIINDNIID